MLAKQVHGSWVMREQDPRRARTKVAKRLFEIAFARPQIIDARQTQLRCLLDQLQRFVAQYPNALAREGLGDGLVQAAVAADAKRVADREIVVAQYGESALCCPQLAESSRDSLDVFVTFVDEIASQGDDVGLLGKGHVDGAAQEIVRQMAAAVKVRKLCDFEPGEGRGQIGDANGVRIQFKPGGFDAASIVDSRPSSAHPVGGTHGKRMVFGSAVRMRTHGAFILPIQTKWAGDNPD